MVGTQSTLTINGASSTTRLNEKKKKKKKKGKETKWQRREGVCVCLNEWAERHGLHTFQGLRSSPSVLVHPRAALHHPAHCQAQAAIEREGEGKGRGRERKVGRNVLATKCKNWRE